jgi:hypothetical protein
MQYRIVEETKYLGKKTDWTGFTIEYKYKYFPFWFTVSSYSNYGMSFPRIFSCLHDAEKYCERALEEKTTTYVRKIVKVLP